MINEDSYSIGSEKVYAFSSCIHQLMRFHMVNITHSIDNSYSNSYSYSYNRYSDNYNRYNELVYGDIPVVIKKRCVSAALVLSQDVHFRLELLICLNGVRGCQHLSSTHVIPLDSSQQCSDIVACLAEVH